MRKRVPSLISGLCLLGSLVAVDAWAAGEELTQKSGTAGCVSEAGGACADGVGLQRPESIAVSPDGKNVYVASLEGSSIAVFDRVANGTLTQKGGEAACISDTGAGACADGLALATAVGVAVSPDGKSVYVASRGSDAIAVFDRAADGTLKQKGPEAACVSDSGAGDCADGEGLNGPTSVAVSPDGDNVYASSWDVGPGGDSLTVFNRAGDGSLAQLGGADGCISETGGGTCADAQGMVAPEEVTVSPDGENVYLASSLSDSVSYWERSAGDGSLTYVGCRSSEAITPCLDSLESLDGASSVVVSPDNQNVYAAAPAGDGGITVFDREQSDGALLAKIGAAGCISSFVGERACAEGSGLLGVISVAASPDGDSVYTASITSGAVAAFERGAEGTLAQLPGAAACVGTPPCTAGNGLAFASSVAVSPDGASVYATSREDAVAILDRGASPKPPPQPPAGGVDTLAPALESLAVKPAKFLAKKGGASVSVKTGGKVSYRVSEAASVRFRVEQASDGRRAGKKCVKPTPSNQKSKHCTRYRAVKGSFTHQGKAGGNSFRFSGRVGGRKLAPARYRLSATATDAAGNASQKPRTANFQIAKP